MDFWFWRFARQPVGFCKAVDILPLASGDCETACACAWGHQSDGVFVGEAAGAGSSPSQAGSEAELDGRAATAWEGLQDESESADGAEVTDRTLREDGDAEAEADAERVEGAVGQDRAESLTESGRAGSELHETGGMAAEVGKAAEQDMVQTGGSRSAVGAGSASGVTDGTVGSVWKQILQVAAVVWLIGVLFTALRKLWIYRRFVKEISACGMENANRRGLSQGGMSRAACAPVSDRRFLGSMRKYRNGSTCERSCRFMRVWSLTARCWSDFAAPAYICPPVIEGDEGEGKRYRSDAAP